MAQMPLLQIPTPLSAPGHLVPQLPQFWESDIVLTQAPLQFVADEGQLVTQLLVAHTSLVPQAIPQLPQLVTVLRGVSHPGSAVQSPHPVSQSLTSQAPLAPHAALIVWGSEHAAQSVALQPNATVLVETHTLPHCLVPAPQARPPSGPASPVLPPAATPPAAPPLPPLPAAPPVAPASALGSPFSSSNEPREQLAASASAKSPAIARIERSVPRAAGPDFRPKPSHSLGNLGDH